jgi:Zn-finger nucleic acid-binding protein
MLKVDNGKRHNAGGDNMKCPVCLEVNLAMTERQGIEIDYCPQCRGVWLDRGELDKIIERSPAAPMGREQGQNLQRQDVQQRTSEHRPYYDDDRDDYRDDYRKRKKRGGFLDELFDF